MTKEDVQFYSAHARALKETQQHKIDKFIEHGCIEYDKATKTFKCKPIPGYNSTTYDLTRDKLNGGFACNCQGFQKRKKDHEEGRNPDPPSCSHVGTLFEWLALRNRFYGWGQHDKEKKA